ncbi:MAG: hypothetical protein J4N92_09690, partial [Chloroflexi bacterium]|nr:hypothetical protein [Chloroflexota bacterium]
MPLGRIALLAAALVMAYLILSGTFSSGQVSLDTGDACENVLLRDDSQQIAGNNLNRPDAYGQCAQPTPAEHAIAPADDEGVPAETDVPIDEDVPADEDVPVDEDVPAEEDDPADDYVPDEEDDPA